MLAVSSLRRIAHSTSLRATGSLIEFCRSSACDVLPRRAAVTASLTMATSPDGIDDATVGAGAAGVLPAGVFALVVAALVLVAALSFAVLSLVAALSFVAAVSFAAALSFAALSFAALSFAALSFAAVLVAFVCSAGALPAESVCRAKPSTPAKASAVKIRMGA